MNTNAEGKRMSVMELSLHVHAEQNQSFATQIELVRDLGYSLQNAGTWRSLPLRADDLERLIPDGAGTNVIARPLEGYEGKRRA